MSLKLAFLGTGTCNATPRNPSSLALSNGREVICIDFGGGAYHQIARLNDPFFHYKNITTILITHFHIDHVSGLPDFLWGEMWDPSGIRSSPITIVGPRGLMDFYQKRLIPFMGDSPIPFAVKLIELSDGDLYEGAFYTVRSYELLHGEFSTGYLFHINGLKLAVTGDTGYCEKLVSLLDDSDVAVMEWGISDYNTYPIHISTADVLEIIKRDSVPERVFVNHMYLSPGLSFEEQVEKNRVSLKGYSDRFYFPRDLEIIELK
jgi:ribonuclease Z